MRVAGFGSLGCGLLLGLLGVLGMVAAVVPGVVNGAEQGTALGVGGAVCAMGVLPVLAGTVLVPVGGRRSETPPA